MSRNRKNWKNDELMKALFLREAGFNNIDIAKQLGRSRACVQCKLQDFGGNANYMKKITKHAHLRGPVFLYFLNHTWDETRDKFKLTDSELKSLFS